MWERLLKVSCQTILLAALRGKFRGASFLVWRMCLLALYLNYGRGLFLVPALLVGSFWTPRGEFFLPLRV